jgi:hypothetical protein
MRTTVEVTDEQRARLLELAARRGEKGFSRIVQEALDRYLEQEAVSAREARAAQALAVLGTLGDEAADELETRVRNLRNDWR